MLSLRSQYRSSWHSDGKSGQDSSREQSLTVGICDYIPQQYFSKQYFSIYIDGISPSQIIQSILWNQYYEKTLLKQIYIQLNTFKRNYQDFLIDKLDNMLSNSKTNNKSIDIIYLKVGSNVYNLKEKLQYPACVQLQQEILKSQYLTVQKITKQGKWKKVSISFAPYQNKSQIDIIFSLNHYQLKSLHTENKHYSDSINQVEISKTATQIKTKKCSQSDNVTMSEKKSCKYGHSEKSKNKSPSKQTTVSAITHRQKTKSKMQKKSPPTHKKSSTTLQKVQHSLNKINQNSNDYSPNQIISNSFQKSLKKKTKIFQCHPSQSEALKEINFNSTGKISQINNFENLIESQSTVPIQMDLKRKEILRVHQHSIMNETSNMFGTDSQRIKSLNDQTKNNSVMAQILSKKQEIILSQKKKMEEMQRKHEKQIEELRLKHLKESQSFKDEVSQILGEYNKKYENEKEESKRLRVELSQIQQILKDNKVTMAELQIKLKLNEEQVSKYRRQGKELEQKLSQLEEKYNNMTLTSRQEHLKLVNERDGAQSLADKYIEKYNTLAKKLKVLAREQQMSIKE